MVYCWTAKKRWSVCFTALVNYRESHQRPLVIVHGGGCVVDELMKGLNLPWKKKNGLRVTPADQLTSLPGGALGNGEQNAAGVGEETPHLVRWPLSGRWRQRKSDPARRRARPRWTAQPGSPKLINTLLEGGFLPVVSSIGVTE